MIPHLQPITLDVIRPQRDLVRLAELKAKNWNPSPLTSSEAIELLELQQRINARLDTLIQEERTEGRAFPSHPNPHCD